MKMIQKNIFIYVAIFVLLGVVFYMDLRMPLGYAGGVPYALPVLLTWWTGKKRWALYIAFIGTALTISGYFLSPAGGEDWIVISNRLMALIIIWMTAFLMHFLRRSTDSMDRALGREHEASEAKTRFITNLAHEVRTPVNGIAGMATLLQSTELSDKQRDYAESLKSASDSLVSILTNLLDLSRMEEGEAELKLSSFQLSALFDQVASAHRANIEAKGLMFRIVDEVNMSRALIADRDRLYQVLNNYVSNATKFTQKGGVTLGATLMEKKGDHARLRLWVQDTGVGMSQDDQDKLFNRFTQVGKRSRLSALGSGLGLSICKEISDLMEGEIGVSSTEGEGSTFFFELECELE